MPKTIISELAPEIKVASSFFSRIKGFLGTVPKKGDALLLVPCRQIHTFFMKAPIDVYYLNRQGRVVKFFPNVKPWRILPYFPETYMVLELGAGTLPQFTEGEIILEWKE